LASINWFGSFSISNSLGNAADGFPVFMLDLPALFTSGKKDITKEFSLFVHVYRGNGLT
jgi:hypothetical protein